MNTVQETIPSEDVSFAHIYSALFALSVSVEVLQALQGILSERKHNYAINKAKEAEKACNTAYKVVERAIVRGLLPEQSKIMLEAVEQQKSTMYDFFLLDTEDQRRVRGLIAKIKKDRE